MSKLGLVDIYEQAQLDGANLLIVADQFEELFRYSTVGAAENPGGNRSGEGVAFVNLLLEASTQRQYPIYVVLTMRSDFLGDCAEFNGLAEAINDGHYLVPRLTRDERRAVVAGPVGVAQDRISPVLLTRLVNDVGDNPDQLSILQHALNRTWARSKESDKSFAPLDLSQYEAIGTMAHALDLHAEKAYAELTTDRQRKICEKVFKAITDKGTDVRGIRRPTRLATLCAVAEATEPEVIVVLDVFRKPNRSFLMPPMPEKLDSDSVIDISHESLMRVWERLKKWTTDEAQSAQLYRRLAETAALHASNKASLWRERELQLAEAWFEEQKPNSAWAGRYHSGFQSAIAFLKASKARRDKEVRNQEEDRRRQVEHEKMMVLAKEQALRLEIEQRSKRRLRSVVVVLVVVLVAAVVTGGFALSQRKIAQQQEAVVNEQKQKIDDSARQIAESVTPTRNAAQTVLDISAQLAEYQDRLERLKRDPANLEVRNTINELSKSVQTWQQSAGEVNGQLRDTLAKQEEIVKQVAPERISAEGWIFLGRQVQGAWANDSPQTIAPVSADLAPATVLTIRDDVYLRGDVEPGAQQSSGPVRSVVKAPGTVEVLEIRKSAAKTGGDYIWAKVRRR